MKLNTRRAKNVKKVTLTKIAAIKFDSEDSVTLREQWVDVDFICIERVSQQKLCRVLQITSKLLQSEELDRRSVIKVRNIAPLTSEAAQKQRQLITEPTLTKMCPMSERA